MRGCSQFHFRKSKIQNRLTVSQKIEEEVKVRVPSYKSKFGFNSHSQCNTRVPYVLLKSHEYIYDVYK